MDSLKEDVEIIPWGEGIIGHLAEPEKNTSKNQLKFN